MTAPTKTPTAATAATAATGPLPAGAVREAPLYYDEAGRLHSASKPVPVDASGRLAGIEYVCRRDKAGGWYPINTKTVPTCPLCHKRMTEVKVKPAPLLPYRQIWDAARLKLLPVAGVGVELTAGAAVGGAHIPAYVLAGLTPVAGVVAAKVTNRRLLKAAQRRGRVDVDAPDSDKRIREAIARQARAVGYTATAATGWLALADATGLDLHTAAGKAAYLALLAAAALPAATWWKKTRKTPLAPQPVEDDPGPVDATVPMNPDEVYTRRIWANIVAAKQGQVIARSDNGTGIAAVRNGRLVETWLEDWHEVHGGWAATAVSPPGLYVADNFMAARSAVASAFRMKTSMITCIPDPEDETRALYLAQRSSPIVHDVAWTGPKSIDAAAGQAPVARYIDGGLAGYEIYRPGWGVPHVAAFGTTGSGKSEFLNLLFAVDRWAHYVDEQGVPHGLVADFLIDPQQGQSFAPFLDDLAAPVATSLEEAMLLVRALTAEMLRRNRYLAREAKTWDPRRKKWRTGRKWWNPLVDGPILALTIDEAHDYLSNREFATLVTKAGRMWRKCGGQLRIGTHTPLLTDLGGSMALRDMLTGGFVWVGRTANRLSGPTAFNGRLPVDPCTIPEVPGMSYILSGLNPKAMLARAMYEPDWYDWVRDADDEPIGYPGVLPAVTLATFGKEYAAWAETVAAGGLWTPGAATAASTSTGPAASKDDTAAAMRAMDVVLLVLAQASEPMSIDELDGELLRRGHRYATRTLRDVLAKLRKMDPPLLETADGRHRLTDRGTLEALSRAELVNA